MAIRGEFFMQYWVKFPVYDRVPLIHFDRFFMMSRELGGV